MQQKKFVKKSGDVEPKKEYEIKKLIINNNDKKRKKNLLLKY